MGVNNEREYGLGRKPIIGDGIDFLSSRVQKHKPAGYTSHWTQDSEYKTFDGHFDADPT
jgi:hypothetical protein